MVVLLKIFPLFFLAQVVLAFQSAILELTITDPGGAVIPNLTARLESGDKIIREIKTSKPQRVIFSNVKPGEYTLEIEAPGFTEYSEIIQVAAGNNPKSVQLEIAQIIENVVVDRSPQETKIDRRDGAFTNFLSKAEIDSLPEDPAQLKQALKDKFGEDAEFFVDGFSSSGLPQKSQITSIKVTQGSFDAEYHKIGVAIIEITTKPFVRYIGSFFFNFNDARLNGREPFSPIRNPEQQKSFALFFGGPIRKDKTSFFAAISNRNFYNTETITARLPDGDFENSVRTSTNNFTFDGRLNYQPTKFQTINLSYFFNKGDSTNLGIGGFDLPERTFGLESDENRFRYSQVGNLGEKYYNEFRFQFSSETSDTVSVNNQPAIVVLDAFTSGGAGNDTKRKTQNLSVGDNLLFGIKNHALKIGGFFEYRRQLASLSVNQNGTFTFTSLDDFVMNKPATFSERGGIRNINFSQYQISAFIQDDVRLRKNLMLSLGLRYEFQNNLNDHNNFSPRLGFSWSPQESGKTTFRGGIGLFYQWFEADTLATILSQDANQTPETVVVNPGFPNPFIGGTIQILPESFRQKSADLQNPAVFLSQFGVERELAKNASLRVQYSHQKTVHQFRSRDVNAPVDFIRPNPNLGRILQFESSAFTSTNSLRVDFSTTPSKATFLSAGYRLAKTTSDSSGLFGLPSDNNNLRLDRSPADIDRRHNINASFGWALKKGFKFSTVYRGISPLPFTITTGRDDNGDTIFNDRPAGIARNSERGTWTTQTDVSLSWQISLEKNQGNPTIPADPNLFITRGKTIRFTINALNLFNQTNFSRFVGVQTSPFFLQPVAANDPRKLDLGMTFSF